MGGVRKDTHRQGGHAAAQPLGPDAQGVDPLQHPLLHVGVEGVGAVRVGRAQQGGLIEVRTYNIRDYSKDKHHRVDDTPYGGGKGLLMAAPPICDCFDAIVSEQGDAGIKRRVIYMSPRGKVLTQKRAFELTEYDNIVILCGHYEGVDERAIEEIVDEEMSIGDYVLTGGELPACVLVDCVSRMIDGVLAEEDCWKKESIASGMLDLCLTSAATGSLKRK